MNSFRVIATALCCIVVVFGGLPFSSNAQLDPHFYGKTCPQLHFIAFKVLRKVAKKDPRMPASIIRLHFHDCFVQVCFYYICFALVFYHSFTPQVMYLLAYFEKYFRVIMHVLVIIFWLFKNNTNREYK